MLRFKQYQRLIIAAAGNQQNQTASVAQNLLRKSQGLLHQNQGIQSVIYGFSGNYSQNAMSVMNLRQQNFSTDNNSEKSQQVTNTDAPHRSSKQGYRQSHEQIQEANEAFKVKFGKTKSELLDSWLDMETDSLIQQCEKYGVKHSSRHIENIQSLFEFVKKFENDLSGHQSSPAQRASFDKEKQQKRQYHEQKRIQQFQEQQQVEVSGQGVNIGQQHQSNITSSQENTPTSTQHQENIFNKRRQRNLQEGSNQHQAQSHYPSQTVQQSHSSPYQNTLPLNRDAVKAKEALNESLQKILAKRRKFVDPNEIQQKQQQYLSQREDQGSADVSYDRQPEIGIVNPFKNINLIKALKNRGQFMQEANLAQTHTKLQNEDSKSFDKIFSLTGQEIDNVLQQKFQQKNFDSIFQMAITPDDLNIMTGINKKKTLLFMQQIQQEINLNPNLESLHQDPKYLEFMKQNYFLLSEKNKDQVSRQLSYILNNDKQYRSLMYKDINKVADFVESLQLFKVKNLDMPRKLLITEYFQKTDSMYQDLTPQNVLKVSRLINFIQNTESVSEAAPISKLKQNHHEHLKKSLTKDSIKEMSFEHQYEILMSLPKMEGDAAAQQKSLPHIILTEMLQIGQYEKWAAMSREQLFNIFDKSIELQKCRDIQNKLRGNLLTVNSSHLSIKDIQTLCEKLTEGGKQGHIDSKVIHNLFMRRSLKTVSYFPNANELTEYINFFDFLYKNSPICFVYLPMELKYAFYRIQELHRTQHLKLDDMVRFSKFLIPSLYNPTFLFKNMIEGNSISYNAETKEFEDTNQSFKYDSNLENTYQLVDETIKRVEENLHVFEHLQLSNSRMHRFYTPYKDKTFMLWWKIVEDLIAEGPQNIKPDELKIINRIFSNEKVITNFFTDFDHFNRVIQPLLESSLELSTQQNKQVSISQAINEGSVRSSFEDIINQMKTLENVLQVSRDTTILNQVNKITENIFTHINQIISIAPDFEIDQVFKVSNQMLGLLDKIKEISLENKVAFNTSTPKYVHFQEQIKFLQEVVQGSVEYFFQNKMPFYLKFESHKKNLQISKKIVAETNKFLIDQNVKSVISFLNHTTIDNGKELALKFCQNMTNGRAIAGKELVSLYNMIDRYGIIDEVKTLLVNTAANLQTIEKLKINRESADNDSQFEVVNRKIEEKQEDIKKRIIKRFAHIQQSSSKNPLEDPLRKEEAILGPLSKVMADVMVEMDDEEVLTCMKILGNQKVDNYHEDFIKKIYERYAQSYVIDKMFEKNQKLFFKIAKSWPYFLRNNAIMTKLLSIKGSSALPKQQSEILGILSQQNVLHPELMESHFDTFIKMKDRESVSNYLKDFLHYSAYLGYQDFDIEKCVQVFRRIHHTPEQVPEIGQLLDLLTIMAVSGTYYLDFDVKSSKFIDDAISLIENKFQGIEQATVEVKDEVTGEVEKMALQYFKSIPSTDKIYHKQQVPGSYPKFETVSNYDQYMNDFESISDDEKPEKKIKDKDETTLSKIEEKKKASEEEIKPLDNLTSQTSEDDEEIQAQDEVINSIVKDAKTRKPQEYNDSEEQDDPDVEKGDEMLEPDKRKQKVIQGLAAEKHQAIYDRKASEATYSEELEFHQYRKKKLQSMDKKSKHLLLFSNINQLNFVDINKSDVVKAWTILYHFRSKSQESVLYDEFESITMRNSVGKGKGHELFAQFYLKLVDWSYGEQFRLQMANKCEKTGWPIDVTLIHHNWERTNFSILFLLQEELCMNTKTQKEEPLGMQKLMIKHLKSFGSSQILTISENDYFAKKGDEKWLKENIMSKLGIDYEEDYTESDHDELSQEGRVNFTFGDQVEPNEKGEKVFAKLQKVEDMYGDQDDDMFGGIPSEDKSDAKKE